MDPHSRHRPRSASPPRRRDRPVAVTLPGVSNVIVFPVALNGQMIGRGRCFRHARPRAARPPVAQHRVARFVIQHPDPPHHAGAAALATLASPVDPQRANFPPAEASRFSIDSTLWIDGKLPKSMFTKSGRARRHRRSRRSRPPATVIHVLTIAPLVPAADRVRKRTAAQIAAHQIRNDLRHARHRQRHRAACVPRRAHRPAHRCAH